MKLRYLNQSEDVQVQLSTDLALLVDMARAMVEKNERLTPGVDVIKLAFQGKILDEKLKVGNYAKEDATLQIFKLSRNI